MQSVILLDRVYKIIIEDIFMSAERSNAEFFAKEFRVLLEKCKDDPNRLLLQVALWAKEGKPLSRKNYQDLLYLFQKQGVLRYQQEFLAQKNFNEEQGISPPLCDAVAWYVEDPTRHGTTIIHLAAIKIAYALSVQKGGVRIDEKQMTATLGNLFELASMAASMSGGDTEEEKEFQVGIDNLESFQTTVYENRERYANEMLERNLLWNVQ